MSEKHIQKLDTMETLRYLYKATQTMPLIDALSVYLGFVLTGCKKREFIPLEEHEDD